MDSRALERLELPKVLTRLQANCASELGRALVRELAPVSKGAGVRARLRETSEARRFTETVRFPPFAGLTDVADDLRAAEIGSLLEPSRLLAIGRAAEAIRRLRETIRTSEDAEARYPILHELAEVMVPRPDIEKAVFDAIDDAGEIKDDASLDLLRARRAIRQAQTQIQSRLRAMLSDSRIQPHLQDAFVTVRDGRYCLPVKAESRGSVPGIVHDRSASGGAFFIEPQAVVDLNNRLRELAGEEREAIQQILRSLSSYAGGAAEDLRISLESAAQLDFAFAKAQLSLQLDALEPEIRDEAAGYDLKQARHPLVEKCVPNDIRLGEGSAVTERGDFDVMLLTGPNTGGKTVVLKTLGLLTAMAGCGLHLPVDTGSWLAVPGAIHVDIGDEQSIEQSLSTFSGHLRNIVTIIKQVQPNDLVLFDEIGAGTDPDEGAALAKAVLRHLSRRGAKVVATTHYGELKQFALSAGRFENASVEFDPKTLRPTYHLRIGVPGASNALDIASRLGLPGELVNRARRYLGRDRVEAEAAAQRLDETQRELSAQTEEARREREEVASLRSLYEARLNKLENERDREIEKARREARLLVEQAQKEADETLKQLRLAARAGQVNGGRENKGTEEARHRLRTLRERVHAAGKASPKPAANQVALPSTKATAHTLTEPPRVGDIVKVRSLDREGEVLRVEGQRIEVRVGAMKIDLKLNDLESTKSRGSNITGVAGIQSRKGYTVPEELQLLGKTAAEAIDELEKYLDDALLAGKDEVRVVHGRGTGALRGAVHQYLRRHRSVDEYHLAPQNEGGEGATIVKLG